MTPIVAVSGVGDVEQRRGGSALRCRFRAKPWGRAAQVQTYHARPTPWAWTLPAEEHVAITAPVVTKPKPAPVVTKPRVVTVVTVAPTVKPAPTVPTKCEPGTLGCPCPPDSKCNWGLRCEAHICVTCPVGTHGCPCDAKGKCPGRTKKTGKLYCKSGKCKKKVHSGVWPFSTTSYKGLGEAPAAPLWAWAAIIGIGGFIFWATLNPPRLPVGR